MTRWQARVFYRSKNGIIEVQHDFDELEDLHELVERGPNFHAIDHIEVRYAYPMAEVTIEDAEHL